MFMLIKFWNFVHHLIEWCLWGVNSLDVQEFAAIDLYDYFTSCYWFFVAHCLVFLKWLLRQWLVTRPCIDWLFVLMVLCICWCWLKIVRVFQNKRILRFRAELDGGLNSLDVLSDWLILLRQLMCFLWCFSVKPRLHCATSYGYQQTQKSEA